MLFKNLSKCIRSSKSLLTYDELQILKWSNKRSIGFMASNLSQESKNQTTVDNQDIAQHAKGSKDWWNPQGSFKTLHSMNLIRVPFIRDGLVPTSLKERSLQPLKGKKILDVGCGGGILSEALARLGADVTGIDASKELIDVAETHSQLNSKLENKPNYMFTTIEEHVENHRNHYDAVVASEIIEHVNNQELFVVSCTKALKNGGRIFFTSPNRTRWTQLLGICVAEYVLQIVPKGTHQYEKLITPNELTFLLERNNCLVEVTYGLMYNFLNNKWEFTGFNDLMFALQAVKTKE